MLTEQSQTTGTPPKPAPKIHAPGIYFGMSLAEYLADPSLSSSGCKDLRAGPSTYWRNSPLNPERIDTPTAARVFGAAVHKLLLEGQGAFDGAYAPPISRDDYPDALDEMIDIRAFAAGLGIKGKSKLDLCAKIVARGADVELWPVIKDSHDHAHAGKTFLQPAVYARVIATAFAIRKHDHVTRAIAGAIPEVSCFWLDDETDVPQKIRIDMLRLREFTELKSFSNARKMPVDKAIGTAMAGYSYGTQGVMYSEGLEAVKKMIRGGDAVVFGPHDPKWVEEMAATEEHGVAFVFVESSAYPAIRVRRFARTDEMGGETGYWSKAYDDYRQALKDYASCRASFGSAPWTDAPDTTAFTDEDFPQWAVNVDDSEVPEVTFNGEVIP